LWNREVAAPDGVLRRARHQPQAQRVRAQVVQAPLAQVRPRPDNHRRLAVEAVAAQQPQHLAFRALLLAARAADLGARPASCTFSRVTAFCTF
jgi:hypothetical protein